MGYLLLFELLKRRQAGVLYFLVKEIATYVGALDSRLRGNDGRRKVSSVLGKDEYRFKSYWMTPNAGACEGFRKYAQRIYERDRP